MPQSGGNTPVSGAVDPAVVARVSESYAYTPLSEVTSERDQVQTKLKAIFNEAGENMDMQKITEISGTPKEKVAKIVELNSRLAGLEDVLGANKELFALREQILNDNRGGGDSGRDTSEIVAAAVAKEMADRYGNVMINRRTTLADAVFEEMKNKGLTAKNLEDTGRVLSLNLGDGDSPFDVQNSIFRSTQIPEGTPDEKGTTGDVGWPPFSTRRTGYVPAPTRPLQIIDLIPRFTTNMQQLKYMEELGWTNTAAERAEGSLYPEATLKLRERVDQIVKIANHIPVTQEQLDDEGQVRMYLNDRVPFMVRQHLDSQILNGTGASASKEADDTAQNTQLVGLFARTGAKANAASGIQSHVLKRKDGNNMPLEKPLNQLLQQKTKITLGARANPDFWIMHPYLWEAIALQETSAAGYYLGSPANDFQMRIWGLNVAQSDALVYNHSTGVGTVAVLGDFSTYMALAVRRDLQVQMGMISDDFLRDIMRIKASIRVGLAVYRPSAFLQMTVTAGNKGLV